MGKARGISRGALAAMAFTMCFGWPSGAGAAVSSIKQGDWRYQALDQLSRAGLLAGHPKGPLSGWTDSLTRYEAAALTLRAVEGLGQAYQAQGRRLVQVAQVSQEPAGPGGDLRAGQPTGEARGGPSSEHLAQVEKLIEEFRAELVTMGAQIESLQTALTDAKARLARVEADLKKHQIDGYMQVRYRDDDATEGRREFQVRRVRVNLRGPVSERVSYRVEAQFDSKEPGKGPGSKAQLRTAYADYRPGPKTRFRMGQAILPWGYELEESVPDLWTGERSLWMDRLFPDQRDIGILFNYRPNPKAPQFDFGVVNGTNINAVDNNDRSNVLARVGFPVKHGTIALSGYRGTSGEGPAQTRQDRSGLSARYHWGEAQFLGEFVTGHDRGSDMRGWYWQLGHPLRSGKPNLLFAKYDQFDENRDRPDDLFKRWSLGYWYDLDKATRLTLVWESRTVGPAFSEFTRWNGNAAYAQMQVKF